MFEKISKIILIVMGGFIAAYGLEAVLIPNQVSDGGVTGLSIIGSKIFGMPLGVLIGILNIPFIWLGYKQIGKSFAIYSVLGIAALSIGTVWMHHIPVIVEGDTLLVTVVGGIILGIGMGIAIRNGGALDGIDMLAILLSKKLPFSTSDLILMLNSFVFVAVSFVFGLEGAFLSAIAYFIASRVIIIIEEGLSGTRTYKIVTKDEEKMVSTIYARLGRSCTLNEVRGGYSGEKMIEVSCSISHIEESKLKNIIREVDPHAFVVVYEAIEIKGGGFKKKDIH